MREFCEQQDEAWYELRASIAKYIAAHHYKPARDYSIPQLAYSLRNMGLRDAADALYTMESMHTCCNAIANSMRTETLT